MSPVESELLRRKQERVFALERALAARNWRPNDPMKADLERDLDCAKKMVADTIRTIEAAHDIEQ